MIAVGDILNRRVEFIDMPPLFDAAILEDNDMPNQDDPMVWGLNRPDRNTTDWLDRIAIEAVATALGPRYRVRIYRRNGNVTDRTFEVGVDHYLTDIFSRGIDPEADNGFGPWPHPGQTLPAQQQAQANPLPQYYADMQNADRAAREQAATMRRLQNELNEQQAARVRERAARWQFTMEPTHPVQFPEGAGEVVARPTGTAQPEMIQADPLDQWIQQHQVTAAPEPGPTGLAVDMEVAPIPARHHRLGGIGANGQVGG